MCNVFQPKVESFSYGICILYNVIKETDRSRFIALMVRESNLRTQEKYLPLKFLPLMFMCWHFLKTKRKWYSMDTRTVVTFANSFNIWMWQIYKTWVKWKMKVERKKNKKKIFFKIKRYFQGLSRNTFCLAKLHRPIMAGKNTKNL